MKSIVLITLASLFLWACNDGADNSTSSTATDSSTIATTNEGMDHTNMNIDTSGMAGKTMMSAMNTMMTDMKNISSTGNPDNDFATLMKAHHISAIEMSQLELARGTDPEMRRIAQKAINEQQAEVTTLNSFLSGHSAHGGGDAFYKESMKIMNNMKMDMDHSGSIDKQFAQMMIPHHQSAIDMAKAYIKSGAHEEKLKTMANGIIASQQKEMGELKAWLQTH